MKPATSTLTDQQKQAVAQSFHDIAVEIGQIRLNAITAGSKLTDPYIVQLQGNVFSLLNIAASLALQDANITLADADKAVSEISVATQAADHALNTLKKIDKAVTISSAVIVLAMAIQTMNMDQITTAARSVVTATGVIST